jgi:glycosyltransferase A (GT-A) superfamily protein (DUF2064 family)
VLFTLSPEAEGRRKPLGLGRPERAAAVFATFLQHLDSVGSDLPGVDLLLSTPDVKTSHMTRHLPQRGAAFGESLRLAIEDAFSLGYERVVVIGNDVPEISRTYLQEAFARLGKSGPRGAVLGPARDGGYALLGLNTPCPEAFESMPWGSRRVARMTEERLLASGFTVERLPTLEDIDNHRSLARFIARARLGALVELAKNIATLLTSSSLGQPTRHGSLAEILLINFRDLRAPPPLFSLV